MTLRDNKRDYGSWYAALTILSDEGAIGWRQISCASKRIEVFDEITSVLTPYYEDIFIPYQAEYLHANDITQVFDEFFPERQNPESGWTHWDLIPLLKDLELEARQEVGEFGADIRNTRWHRIIEVISDGLAPENYGFVRLEGILPEFARMLLEFHTSSLTQHGFTGAVSPWDATLMGELYVLAKLDLWQWKDGRTAAYGLFADVVDRYNHQYDAG